ncbi:SigE family RNA polymerase sigma factor [Jatrophihabitans fulvus]
MSAPPSLEPPAAAVRPLRRAPAPPDESFDTYVAEHQAALVRFATLLAGSPSQAEDLVQEVLVRLYPRWSRIASLRDPHPYVRRCVTNEFLSWKRRWSTRHVHAVTDLVLDQAAPSVPGPETGGRDPELWQHLLDLPPQQRAAVVLRYWEGLRDEEIGEVLSCKPGTVRGHVSRGLAALRAALGETGVTR